MQIGRESSIGIATRYGLNGPGIESQLIPVTERLLGLRIRIPPGAWMFVLYSKEKSQNAGQPRGRNKFG
jgi:hypothetical protein